MKNINKTQTVWIALGIVVVIIAGIVGIVHHRKNSVNGTYYVMKANNSSIISADKALSTITINGNQWIQKAEDNGKTKTYKHTISIDKQNKTIDINGGGNGPYSFNPSTGLMKINYTNGQSVVMGKKNSPSGKAAVNQKKRIDNMYKVFKSGQLNGTWQLTSLTTAGKQNDQMGHFKEMTISGNKVTAEKVGVSKFMEEKGGGTHNGKYFGTTHFGDGYLTNKKALSSQNKTFFYISENYNPKVSADTHDYVFFVYKNGKLYANDGLFTKTYYVMTRK